VNARMLDDHRTSDVGTAAKDSGLGASDDTLLLLAGKGDERAYAQLVDRHMARSLAFAQRVLGNRAEAEDVLQEAFLRVWKKAPTWSDDGARFSTWFYRVVLNLCIDRKRKPAHAALPEDFEFADDAPIADRQLEEMQASELVEKALQALPDRQREAIVLCYYQGLSNKDAADILSVRVKALESLLVRARKNLLVLLDGVRGEVLGELR
jgi:RNA polymerase sigma-70 factor, ECF subfamily